MYIALLTQFQAIMLSVDDNVNLEADHTLAGFTLHSVVGGCFPVVFLS
jgi:hypothetical protein